MRARQWDRGAASSVACPWCGGSRCLCTAKPMQGAFGIALSFVSLTQVQKFQQSQFDPCYFWKHLSDGTRLDIVMYVDDGYAVDATSKAAEAELKQLNDAFKLTLKPAAFFLGNNVTVHDGAQGGAP